MPIKARRNRPVWRILNNFLFGSCWVSCPSLSLPCGLLLLPAHQSHDVAFESRDRFDIATIIVTANLSFSIDQDESWTMEYRPALTVSVTERRSTESLLNQVRYLLLIAGEKKPTIPVSLIILCVARENLRRVLVRIHRE